MSATSLIAALAGPGPQDPVAGQQAAPGGNNPLVMGTVSSSSTSGPCTVLLDGAQTTCVAVIPSDLQGRLLGSAAAGARVIGCRLGAKFYVTDVLSGGCVTKWTGLFGGPFASGGNASMSFSCPAGVITGAVSITAYTFSVGGPLAAVITIDGTAIGAGTPPTDATEYYFNTTSDHRTFPTRFFRQSVSAGSHTMNVWTFAQADGGDRCYMMAEWDPV